MSHLTQSLVAYSHLIFATIGDNSTAMFEYHLNSAVYKPTSNPLTIL